MIRAASMLSMAVLLCTGCRTGTGAGGTQHSDADVEMRDEFTQTELASGEASFYLAQDLCVEAKVTPQEQYINGLKSYDMEVYFETDNGQSIQEFAENPTFFHKSMDEIESILGQEIEGGFDRDSMVKMFSGSDREKLLQMTYSGKEDTYQFVGYWNTGEKEFDYTDRLYSFLMYIEPEEISNPNIENLVWNQIAAYLPDYADAEVSFLDKEETGNYYKEYLEEITGRKLNAEYDCIPVTGEQITELNSLLEGLDYGVSFDSEAEEYCVYRYCFDIDGFPYVSHALPYILKEGEEASTLAKISAADNNTLYGLTEWEQEVYVTEQGLVYLQADSVYLPGRVYQDAREVVSPDTALQGIKDYYSRQVLVDEAVIREVKLVYGGYFGADADGIIQPVLQPFWRVKVYQKENMSTLFFYYDAYTGDITEEAAKE